MQGSTPQHYTIADFLKWNDDKELILNPKFQRGPVWASPARSYLIDSLLRGYPIPKLLLRTVVDRDSRRTIRDVVDGQQRLRTIIDFASNKLLLGPKAGEFRGKRYSDLDDDDKDTFLNYKLTCEQLINASDEDVLEVFLRINSYAVPVNGAELRNARFDNPFSSLVKDTVKKIAPVWELGVLGSRDRVRMIDQSLVAELFGFYHDGIHDGDEGRLNRIYEQFAKFEEDELPDQSAIIDATLKTAEVLKPFPKEPIVTRPHFLIMVAVVMYSKNILPPGRLVLETAPPRDSILADADLATERLREINSVLARGEQDEEIPQAYTELVDAKTSTQRMRSRQIRFNYFAHALAGTEVRSVR